MTKNKNAMEIGDLVYHVDDKLMKKVFMVVDVEDFDGEKDLEIAQVHPVRGENKYPTVNGDEYRLYAKKGSSQYNLFMDVVKKERKLKGYSEKADYEKMVDINTQFYDDFNKVNNGESDPVVDAFNALANAMNDAFSSAIDYSMLKTSDDCLDAINDLKDLHKNFGDNEYLEQIEAVKERLKELV